MENNELYFIVKYSFSKIISQMELMNSDITLGCKITSMINDLTKKYNDKEVTETFETWHDDFKNHIKKNDEIIAKYKMLCEYCSSQIDNITPEDSKCIKLRLRELDFPKF
jgi:Zn-dependent oligopeptidase